MLGASRIKYIWEIDSYFRTLDNEVESLARYLGRSKSDFGRRYILFSHDGQERPSAGLAGTAAGLRLLFATAIEQQCRLTNRPVSDEPG